MKHEIYNKLFDGQHYIDYDEYGKPIPIIRIIKEGKKYKAYNIKNPKLYEYFDTAKEFLSAIGSPATRPNAFDDQTGEDIFWGR